MTVSSYRVTCPRCRGRVGFWRGRLRVHDRPGGVRCAGSSQHHPGNDRFSDVLVVETRDGATNPKQNGGAS